MGAGAGSSAPGPITPLSLGGLIEDLQQPASGQFFRGVYAIALVIESHDDHGAIDGVPGVDLLDGVHDGRGSHVHRQVEDLPLFVDVGAPGAFSSSVEIAARNRFDIATNLVLEAVQACVDVGCGGGFQRIGRDDECLDG